MGSSRQKQYLAYILVFLTLSNGCVYNFNQESLDEYHSKALLTMATLVTYIGKTKLDVMNDFGDPTEIRLESGMIGTQNKMEKVPFDEIWYYIDRRGIPGINAKGSTKRFFFHQDEVVSVDAF